MIENIRGLVSNRKQNILDEQENLRKKIQELNSEIEVLDQLKVALNDDEYFMKITPNDAFNLLDEIGFKSKEEKLDVYMKLVSSINDTNKNEQSINENAFKMEGSSLKIEEPKVDQFEKNDFSFDTVDNGLNSFETVQPEIKEEPVAKQSESKYQKYIEKIENPTEELTPSNEQLMTSCMQAINESVLSDSNSYFLGDITINKQQVMDNMRKLFAGNIQANDVLPILTVGMSYGTTNDESVMDEILDYLKALQVKAN